VAGMKIGVLTSSRADFGIYLPLLKELKLQSDIELTIIAFGTHLSPFHGKTVSEIRDQDFTQIDEVTSLLLSDDKESISKSFRNYCVVIC
jgi:GDP/UDP-N,N'-diacetylbacillosamine 2-epimerase (hydrolysing)